MKTTSFPRFIAVSVLAAMLVSCVEKTPPQYGLDPAHEEWTDPEVNYINRLESHADMFAFADRAEAERGKEVSENFLSLHGMWKFHWAEDADGRVSNFYVPDLDESGWGKIPVPGIWEMNGYGDPVYINVGYAWREKFSNDPPHVPVKENHVGSYRKEIRIPSDWDGKEIIAYFGSVTSNITLYVNGQFVGYSEDSNSDGATGLILKIRISGECPESPARHIFMHVTGSISRTYASRRALRTVIRTVPWPLWPIIQRIAGSVSRFSVLTERRYGLTKWPAGQG